MRKLPKVEGLFDDMIAVVVGQNEVSEPIVSRDKVWWSGPKVD